VRRADDAYSTLYAMLIDCDGDAMKMGVMACAKRMNPGCEAVVEEVGCLPLSSLIHFSAEKIRVRMQIRFPISPSYPNLFLEKNASLH
jgi:hypothetical protein